MKDVGYSPFFSACLTRRVISSARSRLALASRGVPSVLAQPRLRTAEEIAAAADEEEALILAKARVREARVKANAKVWGTRIKSYGSSILPPVDEETLFPEPPPEPDPDPDTPLALPQPEAPTKMTKAMWQALKLPERVTRSGVITAQEVADVLGISLSHARNLLKEAGHKLLVSGRSGVDFTALIDTLYERRTKDSFVWARKLETSLGTRRRNRSLHVVPGEDAEESGEPQSQDEEPAEVITMEDMHLKPSPSDKVGVMKL